MTLILSGTNGLSDVDGSASTPAIRGTDTNTGIFFPAADTIAFAEGGAEVMRIDSSGNVGIGTSSPTVRLQVTSGSTGTLAVQSTGTSGQYPSSGSGLEFVAGSASAQDSILSYNRTSSSWRDLCLQANTLLFNTAGSERARIDSSGNLLVGITSNPNSSKFLVVGGSNIGDQQAGFGGVNGTSARIYHADVGGSNAANTVFKVERISATGRSINAAGTINASGADYAEYMTKAGDFVVAKGDVVGVNAQGLLTNVFLDAVTFVVKSTDPSYVGGDTWGVGFDDEPEGLEAARQKVDRIAFSGQVPVNVLGATPGQYIVPVEDNGGIKGVAMDEADLTLADYMKAVGKVIAVETDGRARIIVKVA